MKKALFSIVLILSLFSLIQPAVVSGQEQINKFGIHILEPADLDKARELVNSAGGDWGWVTVVIRDDEMNFEKWQDFMDQCREKHLVPIVRIATHTQNSYWVKPKMEEAETWTNFLSSLNWPTQDQYVIIFNEPNHAKEWGGEVNPREFARIFTEYSAKLKGKNQNFKILNAGLDLAAPNSKETMDAYYFLREMKAEVPDIFEKLDGWASHSYPNHGFVGKPWETGKVSIKGYEWELWVLKNHFGLQKTLPVFITETGWPSGTKYYDEVTAATYLKDALERVWLEDDRVVAVTPFVLNYQSELFAPFSWFDKDGQPYPQYNLVKSMPKESWWPKQINQYEVKSILLPSFMPTQTSYKGKITIKNIGQAIWGDKEAVEIPAQTKGDIEVSNLALGEKKKVKPGEIVEIEFSINSASQEGEFEFSWGELPMQKLKVLPSSILTEARFNLWEKFWLKLIGVFK